MGQVIREDSKRRTDTVRRKNCGSANTLGAITSDYPCRPAQTVGVARQEIEKWSGHQFDHVIVQTFLSMPYDLWFDLRVQIDRKIH